jgi:hypothetical protein
MTPSASAAKTGEKRQFHRVLYNTPALAISGENRWTCMVQDVSLKSCLLEFPESWEGDPQSIDRILIDLQGGLHVEMSVTFVHRRGRRLGFLCRNIDLESICVLRRIVELNLGDSALLERDFQSLVHPRSN